MNLVYKLADLMTEDIPSKTATLMTGEKDGEAAILLLWDIIADGLEQKDMSEIIFLTERLERLKK